MDIVLNIPHSSAEGVLEFGWNKEIMPEVNKWTDWHTDKLFMSEITKNVVFKYSRFVCDVERLIDDPLNKKGQGIVYTNFEGIRREKYDTDILMSMYNSHIDRLKENINKNTVVVDCHSFPSELSNIDICIGYNEDWSKPSAEILGIIKNELSDYKIGINNPYSNSISPKTGFNYMSVMIEVNKKTYLDNDIKINPSKYSILRNKILSIYEQIKQI